MEATNMTSCNVTNSFLPTSNKLTMSSHELLDLINKVRQEEGENPVRVNQFHERVADELSDFNYKIFVVENLNNTKSKYFELTEDMCMLVSMRESKKVRRIVLGQLKNKFTPNQFQIPQSYSEALRLSADLADKLQEAQPKIEFAELVGEADGVLIGNYAKTIGIGQNRLFTWLRDNKILISMGGKHNTPRDEYINRGYFTCKAKPIKINGCIKETFTTLITGKGQIWLTGRLKKLGII